MKSAWLANMTTAIRLTRSGRVATATELLQRVLRRQQPSEPAVPPPEYDANFIDRVPETIDVANDRRRASGAAPSARPNVSKRPTECGHR